MSSKKRSEKSRKLDCQSLEERLSAVRDTAEDIQNVSKWCMQNKTQYHIIVQAWTKALRKGEIVIALCTAKCM